VEWTNKLACPNPFFDPASSLMDKSLPELYLNRGVPAELEIGLAIN